MSSNIRRGASISPAEMGALRLFEPFHRLWHSVPIGCFFMSKINFMAFSEGVSMCDISTHAAAPL